MKTRNGIYNDLNYSEYRFMSDTLTFVFSSKIHLEKFISRRMEHREKINSSLSKRFNYTIDVGELADLILYRNIEGRGFLVLTDEGLKLCQNKVKYDGSKAIITNLSER